MAIKPLDGVKVIEFSTFMVASTAGKLLAEWGADVIKIDPIYIDPHRTFGSLYRMSVTDEENACWQWCNASKRGISVDYKSPEGQAIIYKLLEDADVFVTNYKRDGLEKAHLTYSELKEKFPKLVYSWATGYGTSGPRKDDPGFDGIAFWCESGFMLDMSDGTTPTTAPGTVGDAITGTSQFMGILLGLMERQKTGKGNASDVSLMGTALFMMNIHIQAAAYYGYPFPLAKEQRYPFANAYKTKDGVTLMLNMVNHENGYAPMMKAIGRDDLLTDERFVERAQLTLHRPEMMEELQKYFESVDAEEAIATLKSCNCPVTVMAHYKDQIENEQAKAAGYLKPYTFPSGRTLEAAQNPVKFVGDAPEGMRPAPLHGEHTREVLTGLGYTPEQIEDLAAKNLIVVR